MTLRKASDHAESRAAGRRCRTRVTHAGGVERRREPRLFGGAATRGSLDHQGAKDLRPADPHGSVRSGLRPYLEPPRVARPGDGMAMVIDGHDVTPVPGYDTHGAHGPLLPPVPDEAGLHGEDQVEGCGEAVPGRRAPVSPEAVPIEAPQLRARAPQRRGQLRRERQAHQSPASSLSTSDAVGPSTPASSTSMCERCW